TGAPPPAPDTSGSSWLASSLMTQPPCLSVMGSVGDLRVLRPADGSRPGGARRAPKLGGTPPFACVNALTARFRYGRYAAIIGSGSPGVPGGRPCTPCAPCSS